MAITSSQPSKLSSQPEETLKLLCALIVGGSSQAYLENLKPEDWTELTLLAKRERVEPVLCMAVEKVDSSLPIPPNILNLLRVALRKNQMRNLSIQHDLADHILPALEGKVSPLIVMKGGALAFTLYSNPGLRPLRDIDLLVTEEQIGLAERCLEGIGFRRDTTEVAKGFEEFNIHHLHLRRDAPHPLILELHRRLRGSPADWFSGGLDWFWTQTEPFTIPNARGCETPAWTFNPTANLLYLSSHLMLFHGEMGSLLLWFYDLHLILENWSKRIDWDLLVNQARELEWAPALSAALKGTRKRFGSEVPEGVVERLDELKQERTAAQVRMRASDLYRDRAVRRWMILQSKDWRGRIKVVWTFLFPSPEYIRWRHKPRPDWLWPLFYPYRWGYMLVDAGLAVWRLFRGR